MQRITKYSEFYRFYLTEHRNRTCRTLHFVGTFLVFIVGFAAVYLGRPLLWFAVPLVGYGFAWVGHYFYEKNKPATFRYPLWSLVSDFRMFFELLFGKISFDGQREEG